MASRQAQGVEMLQKSYRQPMFTRTSTTGAASKSSSEDVSDTSETEFEDDMSDFDEYAGRRSEDSVGNISHQTARRSNKGILVWQAK